MSKDRSPLEDCSTTMGTSCIASRIGELLSFENVGKRAGQAASLIGEPLWFAAAFTMRPGLMAGIS